MDEVTYILGQPEPTGHPKDLVVDQFITNFRVVNYIDLLYRLMDIKKGTSRRRKIFVFLDS